MKDDSWAYRWYIPHGDSELPRLQIFACTHHHITVIWFWQLVEPWQLADRNSQWGLKCASFRSQLSRNSRAMASKNRRFVTNFTMSTEIAHCFGHPIIIVFWFRFTVLKTQNITHSIVKLCAAIMGISGGGCSKKIASVSWERDPESKSDASNLSMNTHRYPFYRREPNRATTRIPQKKTSGVEPRELNHP